MSRINSVFLFALTILFSLATAEVRQYVFETSYQEMAPDGTTRAVRTVNGLIPGPSIVANINDTIEVTVINSMPEPTAIHWHGIKQLGTPFMDGADGVTQCGIPPGGSFTYRFNVTNQHGTFWWHAHPVGQYHEGLVGSLVVHSDQAVYASSADEEHIVLLQDWFHTASSTLLQSYLGQPAGGHSGSGAGHNTQWSPRIRSSDVPMAMPLDPAPDAALINGKGLGRCMPSTGSCPAQQLFSTFSMDAQKRYRLRVINTAGSSHFTFSVDNHTLTIIEFDGQEVLPYNVTTLRVNIGQRYSVLLARDQTASGVQNFWMRARLSSRCVAGTNDTVISDVQGVVHYSTTWDNVAPSTPAFADFLASGCSETDHTELQPVPAIAAPSTVGLQMAVDITMAHSGSMSGMEAALGGISFKAPTTPLLLSMMQGQTQFAASTNVATIPLEQAVEVVVNNLDDHAHPMHIHGYSVWVMASNASDFFNTTAPRADQLSAVSSRVSNPVSMDVFTVPAMGWAVVRFVSNNPGMWLFHCHNEWHMAAGLAMVFNVQPDLAKLHAYPHTMTALCEQQHGGGGAPLIAWVLPVSLGLAAIAASVGFVVYRRHRRVSSTSDIEMRQSSAK